MDPSPPPPAEPERPAGDARPRTGRRQARAEHLGLPKAEREARLRTRLANANFASAIYGQILVLSLLAALAGHHPSAGRVLATVLLTQLVFWIGHAYAEIVDRQVKSGDPQGFRQIPDVLEHEWPLVQAAFPTVVLMLLALAGAIEAGTGIDVAIGFGILQLLFFGYLVGRRSGRPPLGQLTIAVVSGALGLAIVLLKILVH